MMVDASQVSHAPGAKTNWTKPYANVGEKLNELASRVKDTEAIDDDAMLPPIGLSIADLTAVTVNAQDTSYSLYLGRTMRAITTATFLCRVTTLYIAGSSGPWAEVGVFTGDIVANGNASLTRVGFTDVAATFNTTGNKAVPISLSGVSIGDPLWLAWGVKKGIAGQAFELRGMLADDIQSGVFQKFAGRISTMSVPTTTTLEGATTVPAWARLTI